MKSIEVQINATSFGSRGTRACPEARGRAGEDCFRGSERHVLLLPLPGCREPLRHHFCIESRPLLLLKVDEHHLNLYG